MPCGVGAALGGEQQRAGRAGWPAGGGVPRSAWRRRPDRSCSDAWRRRSVSLTAPERVRYREPRQSLGSGQATCIAWSQARGAVFVTDDRRARVACRAARLPATGSIAILVASVRDHALHDGSLPRRRPVERLQLQRPHRPRQRGAELLALHHPNLRHRRNLRLAGPFGEETADDRCQRPRLGQYLCGISSISSGASGARAVDKLPPACEDAAFRDRRIGMIRHDHSQCSDRLPVTQPVYPPAPCPLPPGNFFQTSRRSLTARADRPAGAFAFSAEVAAGHLWRRPPGCGLPPPPTASAPRSNCRSGPRYTARTYPCQRFTPTRVHSVSVVASGGLPVGLVGFLWR